MYQSWPSNYILYQKNRSKSSKEWLNQAFFWKTLYIANKHKKWQLQKVFNKWIHKLSTLQKSFYYICLKSAFETMFSKKVIYRIYFYLRTIISNNTNQAEFLVTACLAGVWAVYRQAHEVQAFIIPVIFLGHSLLIDSKSNHAVQPPWFPKKVIKNFWNNFFVNSM